MLVLNNLYVNAGDVRDSDLISGLGRYPGGENSNSLQYSCLENPMDRGVLWAMIHTVTESDMTKETKHARIHVIGND